MQEVRMNNVIVDSAQFLFVPQNYQGDVKYRLSIVIPKDHPQLHELKAAFIREAKENFTSARGLTNPLVDNDAPGASVPYPFYQNSYSLMLNSKFPPSIWDQSGKRITQPSDLIVTGSVVNVSFKLKAYSFQDGAKAISRYLNEVQFVK